MAGDRVEAYAQLFSGECVFLTCGVFDNEPVFGQATTVHLLRSVLRRVKEERPFRSYGYVFMADHIHLLLQPDDQVSIDDVVLEMQEQFRRDYQQMMGIPGKMVVWQPGYSQRSVQDVEAFATCLDYIHYNPVYHRAVARPEDWLHSSYQPWVERKLYKLGWGWTLPERLAGIRWE